MLTPQKGISFMSHLLLSLFERYCRTWTSSYIVTSKADGVSRIHNRRLAELLSGYEMGHCGRPRPTGRGLRVHFKRETRAFHLFSLAVFFIKSCSKRPGERKRNKPRCCWPAIFASILFSENEKGQRLHGLRHAIIHAHCTCHEQRAMSKLEQAGWDLSSDFFDSLQRAEKSI